MNSQQSMIYHPSQLGIGFFIQGQDTMIVINQLEHSNLMKFHSNQPTYSLILKYCLQGFYEIIQIFIYLNQASFSLRFNYSFTFIKFNKIMKIFCLKNNLPVLQSQALRNKIKAILNTNIDFRTNQDHSMIYEFFKANKFFQKLQKSKGTVKFILAISSIYSTYFQIGNNPLKNLKTMKFMYILQGSLILKKNDERIKYNVGTTIQKKQLEECSEIILKQSCEIAVIEEEIYKKIIQYNQRKEIKQKIQILRKYELMDIINYIHLIYLAYKSVKQNYTPHQIVYNQGDQPQFWYGIIKGEFEFIKNQRDTKTKQSEKYEKLIIKNKKKKNIQVTILEQNQSFGQQQIILNCKRQYSLVCRTIENEILKVPGMDILEVLENYPNDFQKLKEKVSEKKDWKLDFQKSIGEMKINYLKNTQKLALHKVKNNVTISHTIDKYLHIQQNRQRNDFASRSSLFKQNEKTIKSEQNKNTIQNEINRKSFQKQLNQKSNQKKKRKITDYEFIKQSQHKNNYYLSLISSRNNLKFPKLNDETKKEIETISQIENKSQKEKGVITSDDYIKQKQNILNKILKKSDHVDGVIPIDLEKRHLRSLQHRQKVTYSRKLSTSRQFIEKFLEGVLKKNQIRILPIKKQIEYWYGTKKSSIQTNSNENINDTGNTKAFLSQI